MKWYTIYIKSTHNHDLRARALQLSVIILIEHSKNGHSFDTKSKNNYRQSATFYKDIFMTIDSTIELIRFINTSKAQAAKDAIEAFSLTNCKDSKERTLLSIADARVNKRFSLEDYSTDLEFIYRSYPSDTDILIFIADTYYMTSNIKLAHNAYEKALDERVPNKHVLLRLAACCSRSSDPDKGLEYIKTAIGKWPSDANIYHQKGTILFHADKFNDAIEAFTQAIDLQPSWSFPHCSQALCLSNIGEINEALKRLDDFIQGVVNDKDRVAALKTKSQVLAKGLRLEEAIAINEGLFHEAREKDKYYLAKDISTYASKMNNYFEALRWIDKALEIDPKGYEALRDKGIHLYKNGKPEEAIEYYDKSLQQRPDNFMTLRWYGVTLSQLGKEEEAISYFDKALAHKEDSFVTLRSKALSLFVLSGDERDSDKARELVDEALKLIGKAIEINPNDFANYSSLAFVQANLGKLDEAKNAINKCVENIPVSNIDMIDTDVPFVYQYVHEKLKKNGITEDLLQIEQPTDGPGATYALIDNIRAEFKSLTKQLKDDKRLASSRVDDFLTPKIHSHPQQSFFSILRRWNSYTPAIPSPGSDDVGGGYYLYHHGKGIVIDPGYNFIENFYTMGGSISDIDYIFLSHAHDDHTNSLEPLLSLLYQYNRRNGYTPSSSKHHSVTLFMNVGSIMKFASNLNLRNSPQINDLISLVEGNKYLLNNGLELLVLPAYHDELISRTRAVGFYFTNGSPDSFDSVLITSDTSLYPNRGYTRNPRTGIEIIPDSQIQQLYSDLGVGDVGLLIAHLGSVLDKEIGGRIAPYNWRNNLYANHLGLIGTTQLICQLNPSIVAVSEFGEELRNSRGQIIELLQKIADDNYNKSGKPPQIFGGDVGFIYDLKNNQLFDSHPEEFVDYTKMKSYYKDDCFFYVNSSKRETEVKKECIRPGKDPLNFFQTILKGKAHSH